MTENSRPDDLAQRISDALVGASSQRHEEGLPYATSDGFVFHTAGPVEVTGLLGELTAAALRVVHSGAEQPVSDGGDLDGPSAGCAEADHACGRCGDCQYEHPSAGGCHTTTIAAPVHACPPDGSGLTPCCGRTPFELPRSEFMTTVPGRVTCTVKADRTNGGTRLCHDTDPDTLKECALHWLHDGDHADANTRWPQRPLREDLAVAIRRRLQQAGAPKPSPWLGQIGVYGGVTEYDLADTVLAVVKPQLRRLRWERDLAVAHDRQPYPTAWAYEQACKALEQHRQRADKAEASRDAVRELAADLDDPTWRAPGTEVASRIRLALDGDRGGCCDCPHEMEA
jgi:hypothetical protein